jgi:RNA recognition motif-containing protein
MDESYIASLFNSTGAVQSVKVIRDKNTGLPAGYGFVEFNSHEVASQVLACYNGVAIPGTNKTFRLNWGIFGGGTKANQLASNNAAQKLTATAGSSPDYSVYFFCFVFFFS